VTRPSHHWCNAVPVPKRIHPCGHLLVCVSNFYWHHLLLPIPLYQVRLLGWLCCVCNAYLTLTCNSINFYIHSYHDFMYCNHCVMQTFLMGQACCPDKSVADKSSSHDKTLYHLHWAGPCAAMTTFKINIPLSHRTFCLRMKNSYHIAFWILPFLVFLTIFVVLLSILLKVRLFW